MDDEFLTITDSVGEGYYTEKRSKFLAYAHHVASVEEVKDIVADYRSRYYDARHVCYAYMLGPVRISGPTTTGSRAVRRESPSSDKSTAWDSPTYSSWW